MVAFRENIRNQDTEQVREGVQEATPQAPSAPQAPSNDFRGTVQVSTDENINEPASPSEPARVSQVNVAEVGAPAANQQQQEQPKPTEVKSSSVPAVDASSVAQTAGLAPKVTEGAVERQAGVIGAEDSSQDALIDVQLPVGRGSGYVPMNGRWTREERKSATREASRREQREAKPRTQLQPKVEAEPDIRDDMVGEEKPKTPAQARNAYKQLFRPIKEKADRIITGVKNTRTSKSSQRLYKREAKAAVGNKNYSASAIYAKVTADADLAFDEIGIGTEDLREALSIPNSGFRSFLAEVPGGAALSEDVEEALAQLKELCRTTDFYVGVFKSPNLEAESSRKMTMRVIEGRGLRMHPLALKGFNADTDGDDACVSFFKRAIARCVDAIDYLINLAGDLTLDPDFMPFYVRRGGAEPSEGSKRNALEFIKEAITRDDRLAQVICDMYFAEPDARKAAVTRFSRELRRAYDSRHGRAKLVSRCYKQLRRLEVAQFGFGRPHLTNEEMMAQLPKPESENDRKLYRFTEALLDEVTVKSHGVANFQDLRVMMHDYLGEPEGTNPSFRFTANVAKMFVNYDDRVHIGSANIVEMEDGTVEIPMKELLAGMLKYVESAKISDSLDIHERGKQAKETLSESIRNEVGMLPDGSYESLREFINRFVVSYKRNAKLISAANFEISTEWGLKQDFPMPKMETVGDLARGLREVYGELITIDKLVPIGGEGLRKSDKPTFRYDQVKYLIDTYGTWDLNRFAKKNKLFETGGDFKKNAETPISHREFGDGLGWNLVYALAHMRTSTSSKFNQEVFEKDGNVCSRMFQTLLGIRDHQGSDAAWHMRIQDAVELLNLSDPNVYAYFGMDNIQGFINSKYGKALIEAEDVASVKSLRLAMTVEYRMHRINNLEEAYAKAGVDAQDVYDELMYEEAKLASASWAWNAIIKDRDQAIRGERMRPFAMLKNGDYSLATKENLHFKNYEQLKHSTLEDVLLDVLLSKDDKCAILSDVVSVYEQFYVESFEMPEMLERNEDASYSSVKVTSEGVMSATRDFNKLFDKQKRSREQLSKEWGDAKSYFIKHPGSLQATLDFYVDNPAAYCPVKIRTVADAMCSVLDKMYVQSEKNKQHPWTNMLYSALSFARNGGFFSDVYRTDDRALGLQSIDALSDYDIVNVLSGRKTLWVYDDNGGILELNCEMLVGGSTEAALIEFLDDNLNIAATLRPHAVGAVNDGSGYLGTRGTIMDGVMLDDGGGIWDRQGVFMKFADDPRFAALVAFVTPTHGNVARDMRGAYMDRFAQVLTVMAQHSDNVDEVMRILGATEENLRKLTLTEDANEKLRTDIRNSIVEWQAAFKSDLALFRGKYDESLFAPDLSSCYAYYDVRQEFSGAKTSVSTGVEGSETHKLAMFISSLNLEDRYAALGEFVSLGEIGYDELMELFDGCENSLGKKFSDFTDEDWGNGEVIVSLPAGVERGDKSLNDAEGRQVPSVYSYLVVKRDFGAEKFNLKAKKTGDDGRHSVTKHGKYFSEEELVQFEKPTNDYGELVDWLRGIYAGSPENLFQVKLALAKRLLKANEIGGYTEMTLADCMNLADLMVIADENGLRVRSIELIAKAIRSQITFDLARNGTKEQISAVAIEAAQKAGGESLDMEAVISSIRIKPRAFTDSPARSRSSSLELNLNAMQDLVARNPGMRIGMAGSEDVIRTNELAVEAVDQYGTNGSKTYFVAGEGDVPPNQIGPAAVWFKTDGFTEEDLEIIRKQGNTGMSFKYTKGAVPSKMLGDQQIWITPGFDMAVNGESGQFAGTFGVFHRPSDNVVYTFEDTLNEFNLADAGLQLFKALVDRLKIRWEKTTTMTTASLFANTFQAYPDASFSCRLANEQEIAYILSKDSKACIDVGVTPGTDGFDRHWKLTMDAIDRYCDQYQANREGNFIQGGIVKQGAPGDVIGFMTCIVKPLGERPFRAYAPIIPFDLTGHNEVSRAEVPSHYEVTKMSYNNDIVPSQSFLAFDWAYNDDITKHQVKLFEGQSTANKFFTALNEAIEWFTFKGTNIAIDGCYAPESTASRRIGDNKRLGTMQTLMHVARNIGYNYAKGISEDVMFINRQGEDESLKRRLENGYLTKTEWASLGIHSNSTPSDVKFNFSKDKELDGWIKNQICLYARNGGNPTDFLANKFADGRRTDIHWEYECMFGTSPEYQEGLLKFLNSMNDELCPSSLTDGDESKIFRVNQKDHCMQMQVPHKNGRKGYYYSWVNVYAGWSFFNFNDFTGAHRPNINGYSDTLDAIATHQLSGRAAANHEYRVMLERSLSDLGEVKSKYGMNVVSIGRAAIADEGAAHLDREKYGDDILGSTDHEDLGSTGQQQALLSDPSPREWEGGQAFGEDYLVDKAMQQKEDFEWDMRRDMATTIISRFRGDCAFLSNMYDSPITYNGVTYRNAEAAFQAQKAAPEAREELFGNVSGKEARRLGRRVLLDKWQLQDWENAKDDIMKEIVRQKFRDPGLAEKLVNLGADYIEEENTWGDEYWGVLNDEGVVSGENRLGKILMTVNDDIVRDGGRWRKDA